MDKLKRNKIELFLKHNQCILYIDYLCPNCRGQARTCGGQADGAETLNV